MSNIDEERGLLIGLLGVNPEVTKIIGEALGKPGTKSDLQFFNRIDTKLGYATTAIAPVSYPEKLKPLLQTCALTRLHIMVIDAEIGISPEIGEIMVLMDLYVKHLNSIPMAVIANINKQNEWRVEQIQQQFPKLVGKTLLKDMPLKILREKKDYDELKVFIGNKLAPKAVFTNNTRDLPVKVLLDHIFPVKGVGTVALGLVVRGIVKVGEMYDIIPGQKKIILRSIQSHDRDVKQATPGTRVGLALKGVKPDLFDRNSIFCALNTFSEVKEITVELELSPYFNPANESNTVAPDQPKIYHLSSDLGLSPVHLKGGDSIKPGSKGTLRLQLEKSLPADEQGIKGFLVDLGPFQKRLRILGFVNQIKE